MAAGKAYQYHLGFEEETTSQLLHAHVHAHDHAHLLLYPSHHLICQQQTTTTTTRSYLSKQQQQQQHTRQRQRRHAPNWATGGPRMQAVFLGSIPTSSSCGTGVFLPQRPPPIHFQPNTKPLPPAADLNRLRDVKAGGDESSNGGNNKKGKGHSNFTLQSRSKSNSPGVFLPKEWTY